LDNPLALGSQAPLAVEKPLSDPAKLGWVAPLGRNSALDQTYSALDPSDTLSTPMQIDFIQTAPPDQPAVDAQSPDGG
jgi:hypothetical protein